MSRGFFVLVVQLVVCVSIACLGIWTLIRPKSFQSFVHENFGLLPPVKDGLQLTPVLLRLSSIFLLWYSYSLAEAFRLEILWIAGIVKRFVG